jgi:hypothetical protein
MIELTVRDSGPEVGVSPEVGVRKLGSGLTFEVGAVKLGSDLRTFEEALVKPDFAQKCPNARPDPVTLTR